MAPFRQPQKRRKSSETVRNVGSRTVSRATSTQSNARSVSRASAPSRRSSTESLRGHGQQRSGQRPASAATSHTFGEREQSVPLPEPAVDDFDADPDVLSEVVMAVTLAERGSVGCAYYVAREEKLYFMEDVKLGGPDIIDARKWYSVGLEAYSHVY